MNHVQEVRLRHFLTYIVLALVVVGWVEVAFNLLGPNAEYMPVNLLYLLCAFSPFYFIQVVILPIFFVRRPYDVEIDAGELLTTITLSMTYTVLIWALLYRKFGVYDLAPGAEIIPNRDSLYHSMVTFSTLGYGDLRVDPDIRLLAAFEGVWGNLHLALWVGAAFYALGRRAD